MKKILGGLVIAAVLLTAGVASACDWGYGHAGSARTVDSHITRVRKKLEAAGLEPEVVATVHGVGYRFVSP